MKCDGNHAAPECADYNCWRSGEGVEVLERVVRAACANSGIVLSAAACQALVATVSKATAIGLEYYGRLEEIYTIAKKVSL